MEVSIIFFQAHYASSKYTVPWVQSDFCCGLGDKVGRAASLREEAPSCMTLNLSQLR